MEVVGTDTRLGIKSKLMLSCWWRDRHW